MSHVAIDNFDDAQVRWQELAPQLLDAQETYYSTGDQVMVDATYDALMRELRALEEEFPQLWSPDSPSTKVGAKPVRGGLPSVTHISRMYSLQDVFSRDELAEWFTGVSKELPDGVSFTTEVKIDGLALNLTYRNGWLERAATRGDGVTGEDVTRNVRMIASIPDQLRGDRIPELVEIRGKCFSRWLRLRSTTRAWMHVTPRLTHVTNVFLRRTVRLPRRTARFGLRTQVCRLISRLRRFRRSVAKPT